MTINNNNKIKLIHKIWTKTKQIIQKIKWIFTKKIKKFKCKCNKEKIRPKKCYLIYIKLIRLKESFSEVDVAAIVRKIEQTLY